MCLDNADDGKVSGVLNEVCEIAGGCPRNGWVVMTPRQGQPHIWNRMKMDQRLVLEPVCAEDAMVVLRRQIRNIEKGDEDNDGLIKAIK